MKVRISLIGLLVVYGIGVCGIGTAAAQPAGPPAGYKIDPEFTEKSPDGAITIEQYANKETDDYKWQFWVRREGRFTLLDPKPADYPAGFRFTNDLKWLVRMQKTGSGESTLYLYRLGSQGFVPATKKALGGTIMEGFIATKLDEFAKGKISRRALLESLTVAATTTFATGAANAASDPALKVQLINHISYNCPDFRKAADWYSKVFNLDQVGASKIDVALPFGKKGEKPFGVTADDVPLSSLIIRSRDLNTPANGRAPRKSQALIEHMAYTVADFDRERAKAELKSLGVENVRDGGLYSLHMTDPYGYDVQISGVANNALSDGA